MAASLGIPVPAEPDSDWPPESLRHVRIFGVAVAALGALALVAPRAMAKRFTGSLYNEEAVLVVLRGVGPALLAMGAAAWLTTLRSLARREDATDVVVGLLLVVGYLSLTRVLAEWTVDDAAITFAYSKNLANGHGIVIHAGHVPEEGYSNTLWMLFLALAHRLGADIGAMAKRAGVVLGAAAVWLSYLAGRRLAGRRLAFSVIALGSVTAVGAPFVIWSSSGLEHSLQALLFMLIVCSPFWPRVQNAVVAGALSALVLTRPETPLIVTLVGAVLINEERSWPAARSALRRRWPVLVAPAATWLALAAFRLTYFHDLMSNPYYVKARGATWLRAVNFVGGSWAYLFGWLADARTWLLVPIVMLGPWRRGPQACRLAAAICVGQLLFVVYVGGDWMTGYRFISPVLPCLAVLVVAAVVEADRNWGRLSLAAGRLVLVWFLGLGTIGELAAFRANPDTPMAVVARIAQTFVDVGHRLGVAHPSLAHHDAGGSSYETDVDLVDLGGLADRSIAKHMSDPEFVRRYLFVDKRPTFIFGAAGANGPFATNRTKFFMMPEFSAQYVAIRFPGRPFMTADLCHVRRDLIHAVPGIRQVGEGSGAYWVVDD